MLESRRNYLLALAHQLVPELAQRPLYLVTTGEMGITGDALRCEGLVGLAFDLACRPIIGPRWRGRGWCILLRHLEEVEGTWLHEVAHLVDGTMPWFDPTLPENVVADFVREGIYQNFIAGPQNVADCHGPEFHRALIHIRYRAIQAGLPLSWREVAPQTCCPMWMLAAALGNEPHRCRHQTFAQIMARPMPRRFRKLWNRRHVLAGRKDSPMSLVDLIRGLKSRREAAIDNYAGAVARVAEDGKVPLEMLERLLESAGKSPEDFAADVERLRRRTEAAQFLRTIPDCNIRRKQCAQRLADARAIFDRAEAVFDVANNEATVEFDAIRDQEQKIRESRRFLEDTADERTKVRVRETERALQEALNARTTAQAVVERATSVLRIIEQRLQDAQAGRVMQVGERRHIGPEFTVEECQRQVETARAALAAAEKRHDEARQAAEQAEQKTDETRRLLLIP